MKSLRLIPLLLTLVCVTSVVWFVDVSQSLALLQNADLATVMLLGAVAIASRILRSAKWNLLLRSQGIRISIWHAMRLNWAGSFLAFWTPAGLGSDAYRLMALRSHRRTAAVISTLVIERYFGLLSVGALWLLTIPFTFEHLWQMSHELTLGLSILLGCCVWVLVALLIMPGQKSHDLHRMHLLKRWLRQLDAYRNQQMLLVFFFLLSLVEVFSYIGINYLAAHAVGVRVSFGFLVCTMPTVYLLLRLPVSLQGLGFQEGALAYVFAIGGFNPAVGVAISLLQRLIEIVCFVLPGALLAPWNASQTNAKKTRPLAESRFSKV